MTTAESIRELVGDIQQLIQNNITPEGECKFDKVKVRLALEFVKAEIEKSIAIESN